MTNNKITANQIAEFLTANPDFFIKYPQIIEHIQLPHKTYGKTTLFGKQLESMQSKIKYLQNKLNVIDKRAEINEGIFTFTSNLVLNIIKAESFIELEDSLKRYFADKEGIFYKLHFYADINQRLADSSHINRLLSEAIANKNTAIYENFSADELSFLLDLPIDKISTLNLKSAVIAPLKHHTQIIGMFVLAYTEDEFLTSIKLDLFFDFLAAVLNTVLPKFILDNPDAKNHRHLMWRNYFEKCATELLQIEVMDDIQDYFNILLNNADAEFTNALFNRHPDTNMMIQGVIKPPSSLYKKLTTKPNVIAGKFTAADYAFLFTPETAHLVKSAVIIVFWHKAEIISILALGNSNPNYYNALDNNHYVNLLASIMQKTIHNGLIYEDNDFYDDHDFITLASSEVLAYPKDEGFIESAEYDEEISNNDLIASSYETVKDSLQNLTDIITMLTDNYEYDDELGNYFTKLDALHEQIGNIQDILEKYMIVTIPDEDIPF